MQRRRVVSFLPGEQKTEKNFFGRFLVEPEFCFLSPNEKLFSTKIKIVAFSFKSYKALSWIFDLFQHFNSRNLEMKPYWLVGDDLKDWGPKLLYTFE